MGLNLKRVDDNTTLVEGTVDIQHVLEFKEVLREHPDTNWDFTQVKEFDSAAALILWKHWGGTLRSTAIMTDKQKMLFDYIAAIPKDSLQQFPSRAELRRKTASKIQWLGVAQGLLSTFGRILLDSFYFLRFPRSAPFKEISAAAYRSGVTVLPVTIIVGFLIGIVLSYLSSLSLRDYGAESLLPWIIGVGVIRELGPLLTAIVLAGRSGSAITAALGAMRFTQELNALTVLGIAHSRRLVFPRTVALALMSPLLTICSIVAALLGGLLSSWAELGLSPMAFLIGLRADVPINDLYIGLFKSVVFGITIAVIACYYGLTTKPNTRSLATQTTRSVVLAISVIILLDAFFAVLFRDV